MSPLTQTPHDRLRLARNILLAGFGINLAFVLVCQFIFDLGYPYSTFLFRPPDRFQDFYTFMRSTAGLDPYLIRDVVGVPGHSGVEMSNYFPFTHIIFYPFSLMDQELALAGFLAVTAIFYSLVIWAVAGRAGFQDNRQKFFVWLAFLPLNYPVLMAFDRANIELWVFAFVAIGIYFYETGRLSRAAALFALAASTKLFPFIFLFIPARASKWKVTAGAFALFFLLSAIALFSFEGTVVSNLFAFREAMFGFGDFLLVGVNGITHAIGIFSAFQAAMMLWTGLVPDAEVVRVWRDQYNVLAVIFLASALAWVWPKQTPRWAVWSVLCCLVQLLPYPSYDYKLLYTLIPLTLVIFHMPSAKRSEVYIWLMCLTCVPKAWPLFADVRISVIINPILIFVTLVLLMREVDRPNDGSRSPNMKRVRKNL